MSATVGMSHEDLLIRNLKAGDSLEIHATVYRLTEIKRLWRGGYMRGPAVFPGGYEVSYRFERFDGFTLPLWESDLRRALRRDDSGMAVRG